MLDKLIRKIPRPDASHPALARVEAIRRRFAPYLTGRHRYLVAVAAAVALAGAAGLTANAAVNDPPPASATSQEAAAAAAIAERQAAAERADRAERELPELREAAQARAANPEESPEPEPEPTETAEESEPETEPAQAADPEPEPAQSSQADWVHPMPGAQTTSCYGMRWGAMHAGVDLAAPHGTPIQAVGSGTVTNAGWVFGGYGISVVVDHGNGFLTHYAHASEATVSVGQQVSAGQTIALEGSTGDSTGPHLHFEVHQGLWNQVEPTSWMRGQGVTIGGC